MKIYVFTQQENLKNRFAARLLVQERPEDADLILVYEDAFDMLEDLSFGDKPIVFLHSGKTAGIPDKAYRFGIPENYILDASTLRFSQFKEFLQNVFEAPVLPDPYLLLEDGDEFILKEYTDTTDTNTVYVPQPPQKPEWVRVLQDYPGTIVYVTGLHGGVGASTIAAGLYHHISVEGTPVLLFSPKAQPIYEFYLNDEAMSNVYTDHLPDDLPSLIIVDLPYDDENRMDLPKGMNILVGEPTFYDLKLFQNKQEQFERGSLVINKTREDLSSTGITRFFKNIQTTFRTVEIPNAPEDMDRALKEKISPDQLPLFVDAYVELIDQLITGVY